MIHQKVVLKAQTREPLRTDIRYTPDGRAKPILVFLHGFKGFKDWGPFPHLLTALAESGFVTVAFNFSHNGIGEDFQNFTELDRFQKNTFSRELDEALNIVELVADREPPFSQEEFDTSRIGIFGHSRGGAMAILAASHSPFIRAVTALAPVSTFERYSQRQKERWRMEGRFEVLNVRTKQVMPLGIELLDDLELNADRLNILSAAGRLTKTHKPLMVVSGLNDLIAKPAEAQAIATAAGPSAELHFIPHTGHTLGAEHPFIGTNPELEKVTSLTEQFFKRHLST